MKILTFLFLFFSLLSFQTLAQPAEPSTSSDHWRTIWHHDLPIPTLSVPARGLIERGVVILLHNSYGIDDRTKQFASKISQQGYQVLIPDWLATYPANDQQRSLAGTDFAPFQVETLQLMASMKQVLACADSMRGHSERLLLIGIGWGATQAFELATHTQLPNATVLIEGEGLKAPAQCARISAPVYGFYSAESLERNRRIKALDRYMLASGKTFDKVVYVSAQSDFMLRPAEQQTQGSREARREAYQRLENILVNH